jgi:hypothetical protein
VSDNFPSYTNIGHVSIRSWLMLYIPATMLPFKRLVFPHYSSRMVAFLQDGGIMPPFSLFISSLITIMAV